MAVDCVYMAVEWVYMARMGYSRGYGVIISHEIHSFFLDFELYWKYITF